MAQIFSINAERRDATNVPAAPNHNESLPHMATADIQYQCLTYKYKLLPTRKQHGALEAILEQQRILYNAALQERVDAYRKAGKSISLYDQCNSLTEIRESCEGWNGVPVRLQRGTLHRLDKAFKGFFSRVKRGDKPGFPRFRGAGRWNSFEFTEFHGVTIKKNRVRFKGLPGGLRVSMHRRLPAGKPLSVKFIREYNIWHVCLVMRVPCIPSDNAVTVGIDVGISHIATLSTGEHIPNPKVAKKATRELRRRQRALARCKRGSNRRKKMRAALARVHTRIKNTRNTYLHQVSAKISQQYGIVVLEKLKVRNMVKNHHLAHAINDAGWSKFKEKLTYKVAYTGGKLIEIDPRNTSQLCSGCGEKVPKGLGVRTHDCTHCGLSLDRDHNAALVILARGCSESRSSQRKELSYA